MHYPIKTTRFCIKQAQEYISEGYKTVVDIDLEKFFDRVNHDKLMYLLSEMIEDKRLLKLIRAYLESGVMIGGLFSPTDEGTPQGGTLSPLKGYWHTSNSPLACSLTNAYLKDLGLFSFTEVYNNALNSMNRRMPNGTYGGVSGRNGK